MSRLCCITAGAQAYPKSSRLLKRRDFQFRRYRRYQTEDFRFIYTCEGKGRLGVSISRKVLRRAVARNRVRRLLREAFRRSGTEFQNVDLHAIALAPLQHHWKDYTLDGIVAQLGGLTRNLASELHAAPRPKIH